MSGIKYSIQTFVGEPVTGEDTSKKKRNGKQKKGLSHASFVFKRFQFSVFVSSLPLHFSSPILSLFPLAPSVPPSPSLCCALSSGKPHDAWYLAVNAWAGPQAVSSPAASKVLV